MPRNGPVLSRSARASWAERPASRRRGLGRRRSPGAPGGDDHQTLLRALGQVSSLIVPLPVQGLSLGAITCATGPDRLGYRPSDVAAVEELASRTARAIERISLFQESERAAAESAGRAKQLHRLNIAAVALGAPPPGG